MRNKIKVIIAYIFRGWEDEPNKPHKRIKIIPPFVLELIGVAIIIKIILYLWSLI
jgi:hypothetical protein